MNDICDSIRPVALKRSQFEYQKMGKPGLLKGQAVFLQIFCPPIHVFHVTAALPERHVHLGHGATLKVPTLESWYRDTFPDSDHDYVDVVSSDNVNDVDDSNSTNANQRSQELSEAAFLNDDLNYGNANRHNDDVATIDLFFDNQCSHPVTREAVRRQILDNELQECVELQEFNDCYHQSDLVQQIQLHQPLNTCLPDTPSNMAITHAAGSLGSTFGTQNSNHYRIKFNRDPRKNIAKLVTNNFRHDIQPSAVKAFCTTRRERKATAKNREGKEGKDGKSHQNPKQGRFLTIHEHYTKRRHTAEEFYEKTRYNLTTTVEFNVLDLTFRGDVGVDINGKMVKVEEINEKVKSQLLDGEEEKVDCTREPLIKSFYPVGQCIPISSRSGLLRFAEQDRNADQEDLIEDDRFYFGEYNLNADDILLWAKVSGCGYHGGSGGSNSSKTNENEQNEQQELDVHFEYSFA